MLVGIVFRMLLYVFRSDEPRKGGKLKVREGGTPLKRSKGLSALGGRLVPEKEE